MVEDVLCGFHLGDLRTAVEALRRQQQREKIESIERTNQERSEIHRSHHRLALSEQNWDNDAADVKNEGEIFGVRLILGLPRLL